MPTSKGLLHTDSTKFLNQIFYLLHFKSALIHSYLADDNSPVNVCIKRLNFCNSRV